MNKKNFIIILSSLALTGCSVGPDYVNPKNGIISQFNIGEIDFDRDESLWKEASPNDVESRGDWWAIFNDEKLKSYLEDCRKNNPSLASIFYRVEQAREKARMSESELYPQIDGNVGYSKGAFSQNSQTRLRGPYENWAVGFGLTWDLDLFGRVKNLLNADIADTQSLMNEYENMLLLLQTNVAHTYFTLSQYESEKALLKKTISVREEQSEFVKKRVRLDFSNELDLQRALQQEYDAKAQLATLNKQISLAKNYLSNLIGEVPDTRNLDVYTLKDNFPYVPKIIPSELLERRPDIAAAERKVCSANYKIGAAQAAFFPTILIAGSTGLESAQFSKLFNSSSYAWGINPQIYIPIFQGARLYADKQMSLAVHKETLEFYKSTVLNAIREVKDSLCNIKNLKEEYSKRKLVSDASQKVEKLTRIQYDSGYVDYFSVSDAQRLALINERECIRLRGEQFRAYVSLIASLGGGWLSQNAKDYNYLPERILNSNSKN